MSPSTAPAAPVAAPRRGGRAGSTRRVLGVVAALVVALHGAWTAALEAPVVAIPPGATGAVEDGAAEDPAAPGAAGLVPPTSSRYGDTASYEIVEVRILEGDALRLQVELGAVDPSGGLPVGITQPIVEVYLDTAPGGATDLLPGSGLRMPDEHGWNVAVRISGDGAWAWTATEDGTVALEAPVEVDASASGRVVHVLTTLERPERVRVHAISGVYDPFRPDGWRPLSRTPSPWAFSSPDGTFPVVDVYPGDGATLARTLERGVLPAGPAERADLASWVWFALMFLGLALAVLGLVWRRGAASPGSADRALPTASAAGAAGASGDGAAAPDAGGRWTTVPAPGPILRPGSRSSGRPAVEPVVLPDPSLLIGDDEVDDAVLAGSRAARHQPEIDEPPAPRPEIEDDAPPTVPAETPEIDDPVDEPAPRVPEHDEPEIEDDRPDVPGYDEPEDAPGARDDDPDEAPRTAGGPDAADDVPAAPRGPSGRPADAFARFAAASDEDPDDDLAAPPAGVARGDGA